MNYFPTYLAMGEAFCNRKDELKRLIYDMEGNTPVLLISPRRYGKTSLALKALENLRWPFSHIDLYQALSEEDIAKFILNGIGQLLGKIETTPKKLLSLASDFFAGLHVKVILEQSGIAIEFNQNKQETISIILKSLEKLHDLAKKKDKRVILFLDEFQVVGEVTNNNRIEAAIREAAQKSTNVAYVFSGSNRHLMEQIFYDKKRPFYKLCDFIKLERIHETDYTKYIQNAAKKKWKVELSDNALTQIFDLAERHPHYINKLCSLLWLEEKAPTNKKVLAAWHSFTLESKSITERELALLSINQRKLLITLANHESTNKIFSKHMAQQLNLTASSIQRALEPLIDKDYVYIDSDGFYKILDPLIKSVLSNKNGLENY
jgi:AAA+ ATPase superfamily predicted ATPase